ncbi:MAG: heme-binding protein [Lentisphaerae bacterium]|nr:heme-binding protein [Lentisphaerota bacterium]
MAVEEAKYTVVERDGRFELRDYAPQVLAETLVDGSLEDAGNQAFGRLFRYISGANQTHAKLAMTAPVSQESSVKIPMTAPVSQVATGTHWAVSFMMPTGMTVETLPTPNDPAITLHVVPARRMAAVRYSGTWSERGYTRNQTALEDWITAKGLVVVGEPVWARYNPPFTPWFWRRNEILIPVGATVVSPAFSRASD